MTAKSKKLIFTLFLIVALVGTASGSLSEFDSSKDLSANSVSGSPTVYHAFAVYWSCSDTGDGDAVINCANVNDKTDLAFIDEDGSTVLPYEHDTFDSSSGGVAWVYDDYVLDGNQDLSIAYGNGGTDYENVSGTWSNTSALGVYHNPSQAVESTGDKPSPTVNSVSNTSGVFGGAGSFDGSTSYTSLESDFDFPNQELTLVSWAQTTSDSYNALIDPYDGSQDALRFYIESADGSNNNGGSLQVRNDTGRMAWARSTDSFNDNSFRRLTGSWDGSKAHMYYDNIKKPAEEGSTPTTGSGDLKDADNIYAIGRRQDDSFYMDGKIGETRIYGKNLSQTVLDALWNASDPGGKTLFTASSESPTNTLNASFTVNTTLPEVNKDVSFDASGSSDDGNITSYEWDWTNDGSYEATGETATHSYSSEGVKTVKLRVTDEDSNTDTVTKEIDVQNTSGSDIIDDFEDGDISEYQGDTGSFSTSTNQAYNGTYSAFKSSGDQVFNGIERSDTQNVDGNISFRIYNTETGDYRGGGGLFNGQGDGYVAYTNFRDTNSEDRFYICKVTDFSPDCQIGARTTGDLGLTENGFYQAKINKDSDNLEAWLYTPSGTEVANVATTDSTYSVDRVGILGYDQPFYLDYITRESAGTSSSSAPGLAENFTIRRRSNEIGLDWDNPSGADKAEILVNGSAKTNITDSSYLFDEAEISSSYNFTVRTINSYGSNSTSVEASTRKNLTYMSGYVQKDTLADSSGLSVDVNLLRNNTDKVFMGTQSFDSNSVAYPDVEYNGTKDLYHVSGRANGDGGGTSFYINFSDEYDWTASGNEVNIGLNDIGFIDYGVSPNGSAYYACGRDSWYSEDRISYTKLLDRGSTEAQKGFNECNQWWFDEEDSHYGALVQNEDIGDTSDAGNDTRQIFYFQNNQRDGFFNKSSWEYREKVLADRSYPDADDQPYTARYYREEFDAGSGRFSFVTVPRYNSSEYGQTDEMEICYSTNLSSDIDCTPDRNILDRSYIDTSNPDGVYPGTLVPRLDENKYLFFWDQWTQCHSCGYSTDSRYINLGSWKYGRIGSLSGTGYGTTQSLNIGNDSLVLNADADGGSLDVEVLDSNNNTISGYGYSDFDTVTGNSTRIEASWNGDTSLPSSADRLNFSLSSADLYTVETYGGYESQDTTAPSVTIDSPLNQTYNSSSLDLNVTSNEAVETWQYSLDGAANQTFTPNISLTGLSKQQHTLDVYANDTQGNWYSDSVVFTVDFPDVTPPNTTSNLTQSTYFQNEVIVELNATDDDSGVANISYSTGNGFTTVSSSLVTFNLTGTKSYNVSYYATDNAGNQENTTSEIVTLETLNADFFYDPDNPTTNDTITFDGGTTSGNIQTYRWDFQDDGTFDATGEEVQKQFDSAGTKTVLLEVENVDGDTDTYKESIEVLYESANKSVIEQCDSSPFCYEDNASFTTSNPVEINGSFTELDNNKTFEWKVNATGQEGVYDFFGFYNSSSSRLNTTEYTDILSVEINEDEVNFPPNPDFNIDITDLSVDVDASASTDDGTIISYEWDWTNDGSYENTGLTQSHTYSSGGDYTIKLKVTDNNGSTSTASKTVSVAESTNGGGGGEGTDGGTDDTTTDEPTASTDGSSITLLAPHRNARYTTEQSLRIEEGESKTVTISNQENTIEVKSVESQSEVELIVNGIQGQYNERDGFDLFGSAYSLLGDSAYVADIVQHNNTGYVYFDFNVFTEQRPEAAIAYNFTVNNSADITIQSRETGFGNDWKNISTNSITSSTTNNFTDFYQNFDKGIYEVRAIIEDSSGNTSITRQTGVYIGDVPYINITDPSPGRTFERIPNGENGYSIPLAFKATTLNNTEFGMYYIDEFSNIYDGQTSIQIEDESGLIDRVTSFFNSLTYIDGVYEYLFQYDKIFGPAEVTFSASTEIILPEFGEYTGYANSSSNYSGAFQQWNATSIGVPIEVVSLNGSNIGGEDAVGVVGTDENIGDITTKPQTDEDFSKNVDGDIFRDPTYWLYEPFGGEEIETVELDELSVEFSFLMGYEGNMTVDKTLYVENAEGETINKTLNPAQTQFVNLEINQTAWSNNEWAEGQYNWWVEYTKGDTLVYSTVNRTDGNPTFTVDQDLNPLESFRVFFKDFKENIAGLLNTGLAIAGFLVTLFFVVATYILVKYNTKDNTLALVGAGTVYAALAYMQVPPQTLNFVLVLAGIMLVVGKFTLWVIS